MPLHAAGGAPPGCLQRISPHLGGPILSHVSVPVTIDLPKGYRRVAWTGRLGRIAAVVGEPERAHGAVLLVHGFTGSKEDYFAVLGPLHERGWAVAAIDLPGMAESEGPAQAEHYTLELLAGDLVAMLRQWGGTRSGVHLVGHSIGGFLTREAVLRSPEDVASLTLYSSGPGQLSERARNDATLLMQLLQHHTPAEVQLLKERVDAASGQPAPPPVIAAFLRRRWASTSPGHLNALAQLALSPPAELEPLAETLATSGVAAMVLRGAQDDIWQPEQFAALTERIAATSVVIPGAGHSAATEAPQEMAEALDAFWHGHQ
jgi:pimeloyl-ACP methyl ester carboxylesterase